MAVDNEFISRNSFNTKFKNYLRDIYVYQFKNKDFDFYDAGTFSRSRLVAAIIVCKLCDGVELQDLYSVKMKDIKFSDDGSVAITFKDISGSEKSVNLGKPWSEMFRYLYTAEDSVYFLTGTEAKFPQGDVGCERIETETKLFKKGCPSPMTEDKMHRYWGQIYIDEANEHIASSTYGNDSLRLKTLVGKMAGVEWQEGSRRSESGEFSCNTDDCVECVTADTRALLENPFHLLYRSCNQNNANNEFACIFFVLILLFNCGRSVRYGDEPTAERMAEFDEYLKEIAADLASVKKEKTWETATKKQKDRWTPKIFQKFMKDSLDCIVENTVFVCEELKKNGDKNAVSVIAKIKKKCVQDKESDGLPTWQDIKEYPTVLAKIKEFILETEVVWKPSFMDIFFYMLSNNKQIEFDGNNYVLTDSEYFEKKRLYLAVIDHVSFGEKQFSNIMRELVKKGIVCELTERGKTYYCLSDYNLKNILGNDEGLKTRFAEMVAFFSQTAPLGEVGNYILDRLPSPTWKMYYKHNYIVRALNDFNIVDLLFAMQTPKPENHYWVRLKCRDPLNRTGFRHFVCYPMEIRENVSDGRQALIYYHPGYRSVSSVRLDFIDSITVCGTKTEYPFFEEDITRAVKLIKYTWGLHFGDFYAGNVKAEPHPSKVSFVIRFKHERMDNGKLVGEKFIRDRIKRELRVCKEEKLNDEYSLLKMTVYVVNPMDMLHWMKTYTRRIYDISIEYNSFMDDVERADALYTLGSQETTSFAISAGEDKIDPINDLNTVRVDSLSEDLFNEIYSSSMGKFADILYGMIKASTVTDELVEGLKYSYVGDEPHEMAPQAEWKQYLSREKQYKDILSKFTAKKGNKYTSVFAFAKEQEISDLYELVPLTEIEIQWLLNILDHNQARGFLTKDEIDAIKEKLPEMSVFNVNRVVLYDKHSDEKLEKYYEDSDFGVILRNIMSAISERKIVWIKYRNQNDVENEFPIIPYCIEYSKRDNRFRVNAVGYMLTDKENFVGEYGRVFSYPLDGILAFKDTGKIADAKLMQEKIDIFNKENKKTIVIFFPDSNGIPDRILTEFSCYKKTCIKWGNGTYRMTLEYFKEDYMEIVIRLLGYGSLITVKSEDSGDPVVNELMKRYHEQVELYREKYRYIGEHETEPERKQRKEHEDREEMER